MGRRALSAKALATVAHIRDTTLLLDAAAASVAPFGPVSTVTSSAQARLFSRARRIAQRRHPNLVRMLPMPGGAGLSPTLSQGRRLSELTPAGTFKRFQLEQVVRLLLDVLSGLSALHEDVEDGAAFVHGEVSPAHIFVADDGTARLVPVLGRHWQQEPPTLSNGYAAPEYLLSARVDFRADLFSVGVMLGEALTGRPLFPDPALDAVLARLLGGKLLPLLPTPENRWALPLGAIAERAISPYPELRFQSAVEFSNAIGAAVAAHFARREQDVWHAEAPTLVRVPSAIGAFARTLTPLSTVLDLSPPSDAPLQPSDAPLQPSASSAENTHLIQHAAAHHPAWPLALGALAAAAAIVLAFALRSPARPQLLPHAATPGELAQLGRALRSAPSANGTPEPSARPFASAALPALSSMGRVSPAPAAPAERSNNPRRRAKPSTRPEDYGI